MLLWFLEECWRSKLRKSHQSSLVFIWFLIRTQAPRGSIKTLRLSRNLDFHGGNMGGDGSFAAGYERLFLTVVERCVFKAR